MEQASALLLKSNSQKGKNSVNNNEDYLSDLYVSLNANSTKGETAAAAQALRNYFPSLYKEIVDQAIIKKWMNRHILTA